MSYNNFANNSPLVAIYNNTTQSSNGSVKQMNINTSLYQGTISSDEVTCDYKSHLMGDFYGTTTVNLSLNSCFVVDSVEQFESTDTNKGSSSLGSRGPENFFAKPPASTAFYVHYKRYFNASWFITTAADYPRITGVTS